MMQVHVEQVTFQAFKRNGHRVLVPANPYSLRCPQFLPGHSRDLTGRSSCSRGSGHEEYRHIEAKAAGVLLRHRKVMQVPPPFASSEGLLLRG